MTRLVLFDIDGTLVHTGGAGMKAFAQVFAHEFNLPSGTEKIKFAGRTDVSLVREFFGWNNVEPTPENFTRFFERYVHMLDHVMASSRTEECPGIRPFIKELKALPQRPLIGLLTGNIALGAEIKLRHFNLWEEFEMGAFADDHEDRNQIAHAAVKRASRVLGQELRGEEVVIIGDTTLDIRCARAVGARVLAVATGGHQFDVLKAHSPDWLVHDLSRLSARAICS